MKSTHWKLLAVMIGTVLASHAQAGQEGGSHVGNGGDVIVCPRGGERVYIELLDYVEVRKLRGRGYFDFGGFDLTPEQKIQMALDRLGAIDAARSDRYRQQAAVFFDEANFVTGQVLEDIPDSAHLSVGVGCSIQQLVIQQTPSIFNGYKRYQINQDLWSQMDSDQKAGTVLHELIYRHAIELGHLNSISARFFNAFIATKEIETVDASKYLSVLHEIKMADPKTSVRLDGIDYLANDISYYPGTQKVQSGNLYGSHTFNVGQRSRTVRNKIALSPQGDLLSGGLTADEIVKDGDNSFEFKFGDTVSFNQKTGEIDLENSMNQRVARELTHRTNMTRKKNSENITCPTGLRKVEILGNLPFHVSIAGAVFDDSNRGPALYSRSAGMNIDFYSGKNNDTICLAPGKWYMMFRINYWVGDKPTKRIYLTARNFETKSEYAVEDFDPEYFLGRVMDFEVK